MATIRIKGFPALLLLLAFFGFQGFRFMLAGSELDEAGEEIAILLQGKFITQMTARVAAEDMTEAQIDSMMAMTNIAFPSIKAHGSLDDTVLRVEVLIDGKPPADGAVQYWEAEWSRITGWRVGLRTDALSYWLRVI